MNDALHQLVLSWAEATYNDPGEAERVLLTEDADEAIRTQLTTNTGTHFLDSGGAYGRHHEENRENPPWEKPRYDVGDSYVLKNVYHHMNENLRRDSACVALETFLFAEGEHSGDYPNLGVMKDVAEMVREPADAYHHATEVLEMDPELADYLYGIVGGGVRDLEPNMTFNTYNFEFGSLTQDLQGTVIGGPYGEYALIQVHQGADIRGGYTAPRAYVNVDSILPGEFWFHCTGCENDVAESVAYDSGEWLEYHPEENEIRCADCGSEVRISG